MHFAAVLDGNMYINYITDNHGIVSRNIPKKQSYKTWALQRVIGVVSPDQKVFRTFVFFDFKRDMLYSFQKQNGAFWLLTCCQKHWRRAINLRRRLPFRLSVQSTYCLDSLWLFFGKISIFGIIHFYAACYIYPFCICFF